MKTIFTLTIQNRKGIREIKRLRKESEFAFYAFLDNGEPHETLDWETHENDMREFSKRNHGTIFVLQGEVPTMNILWKKYFKDGLMAFCPAYKKFKKFKEDDLS